MVVVTQVSDVRGKVVKQKARRTPGYSMAAAKLSQEDAISLGEVLLAKYTAHKEEIET